MKDKDFLYWIKASLIGHIVVMVMLNLNLFFFKTRSDVKNSLRVDVIDLPDKVKKLSKATKEKRSEKKAKKKNKAKAPTLNQKSKAQKKQDSKVPSPKKEERMVFKGNLLAEGQGLEGLNRLSMQRYYEQVGEAVREHFVIPQWLQADTLRVAIEVTLDDKGKILTKTFLKGSGNEIFDRQALEAIIKAEPLPEPPERVKSLFYKINFILKFPE